MNTRLLLFSLVAGAIVCPIPRTASAKIFPKIFVTTRGGTGAASASPFGGNGTIDSIEGSETDPTDFGTPLQLLQNLAMPIDIAVSSDIHFVGDFDDIIYTVIGGKGIISAFSTSGSLLNSNVATVPKGKPVGIAAFGENVFVADFTKNKINEYTSSGALAASFSKDINHPNEITASGGNLFVVNQGGKIGEYITEYNATTGQQIDGKLIQNLSGPIQIAVSGTDLFILSNHTISELDLITKQLTQFKSGLNASDIATFEDPDGVLPNELFVTNVSNHSVDVYDIATKDLLAQITGLHGRLQGIDVIPVDSEGGGGGAPDPGSTWLLLLLGLVATFGFKLIARQPA